MMTSAEQELQELQEQLANVRTAINTVLLGAASYTLTTGQTTQQVTRASLGHLRALQQELRVEIARLERRICPPGPIYVRSG